MTQVDFYILERHEPGGQIHFATQLAEKLYRSGFRLHLHTDNAEKLQRIDDSLWTARDISFVPHERSETPLPNCPITLGTGHFEGTDEILFNLADNPPEYFSHFKRVVEIIDTHAADVDQGRARYRYYRERGYPLKTHPMR